MRTQITDQDGSAENSKAMTMIGTIYLQPPLPLEAKKALLHLAANQIGVPKQKFRKLGLIDIKKAYFHAKAKRLVYVDLPDEALSPGEKGRVCGKLNF